MHAVLVAIALVIFLVGVRSLNPDQGRLIIDTDGGPDDAVAIALISKLASNVLAITCTYGNSDLVNVVQNVQKTLTTLNRTDIPIYIGAKQSLLQSYQKATYYGNDGFGDFVFDRPIEGRVQQEPHASVQLVKLVKQYPGEVTILALGPLTNIAVASFLDPTFLPNLKSLYILGGTISGDSNYGPGLEFNFSLDPDANFAVLNNTANTQTFLIPWEAAVSTETDKSWRLNTLGRLDSDIVRLLNKAEQVSLEYDDPNWICADAVAAAIMLYPELIELNVTTNVLAVRSGEARGTLLMDYYHTTGRPKNANIVKVVNKGSFLALLSSALS